MENKKTFFAIVTGLLLISTLATMSFVAADNRGRGNDDFRRGFVFGDDRFKHFGDDRFKHGVFFNDRFDKGDRGFFHDRFFISHRAVFTNPVFTNQGFFIHR